ncbi:1-acyl-sn-glycerol-3-phosphate acyltransferase [Candidatus Curtissbacteria bacterium]|nr:1-acyl-sn-glycerol-3-phosphate acyltransferase [Candidatus Curtissbacteria bacterium]
MDNLPLFFKIPKISSSFRSLEDNIKEKGLQSGVAHFLSSLGTEIEVIGLNREVKETLLTRPVLVIANHPNSFDPLAILSALPPREDAYVVLSSDFYESMPSFGTYAIPVYIRNQTAKSEWSHLKLALKRVFFGKSLTREEEKTRNQNSLNLTSRKLTEGGSVLMFPSPGKAIGEEKWKRGVGMVLKTTANTNLKIVMAYITGTSPLDYLRVFPQTCKYLGDIWVTYSKPYYASKLLESAKSAEEITEKLQGQYENWVNIITKLRE